MELCFTHISQPRLMLCFICLFAQINSWNPVKHMALAPFLLRGMKQLAQEACAERSCSKELNDGF